MNWALATPPLAALVNNASASGTEIVGAEGGRPRGDHGGGITRAAGVGAGDLASDNTRDAVSKIAYTLPA